jgi:hypothetical protein
VLGELPPDVDAEEAGVAVAPALPVLDAGGDGQAEVGHQVAVGSVLELGVVGEVAGDGDVGVGHSCALLGLVLVLLVGGGGPVGVLMPPSCVVGQQVPAGVGVPVWSATVLASCLLVGHCSSPAPGDRVSPGLLDDDRVKGGRRPSRRDAELAERP